MKVDIFNTDKKYDIIYADPPWKFLTYSDKGKGRSAEKHYPTMSKDAIEQLPISKISAKNSVLFLWVTAPCFEQGLELIKAWGYTYKTVAFTWVKLNKKNGKLFMGMGYYTRANAEYCLLATKGKVLERKSKSVPSAVVTPIERHSKKPDVVR